MPGGVDLHTHTTASDGTYTPSELVAEASRRGVRVLAVTDHDSTEGLAEAMEAAARSRPLEILPGIEINCDVEGAEIHVLGYCMDYEAPWFQDFCRAQREERRARVHRMAERLGLLGMPIDVERVFALVQEGSAGRPHVARVMVERLAALGMPLEVDEVFAIVKEGSAGRPHVAQVMVARGYVKTVREAFDKYLGSGKPGHVQRKKLTPEDAVRLIRKAGGVPVFAHPGLADRDALIPGLIAAGLMGIECYYTEHSAGQRAGYLQLCKDHDLVATGGSDFHGPKVRAASLGSPAVPMSAVDELRAKAAFSRAALKS